MIRFSACLLALCFGLVAALPGCAPAQTATDAANSSASAPTIAQPATTTGAPVERAQLQNKAIDELSGLAASRRYPGLLWCHNDSGDVARIFAVNAQGETVATVNFDGIEARDWEDMTAAGQYLYVADLGDNLAVNENIRVYRLREPELNPDKLGQNITLKAQQWEEMTLFYPDGPRDAETLAATPDGRLLIVSKNKSGSNFYALRRPFSGGQTAKLEKIFSDVPLGKTGWLTRLVTGGDLSPDGRELTLVTYAQVLQFDLARPFDFASLKLKAPRQRDLPPLKQCESVCYSADGRSLWVSSEGKGAPLWELPLRAADETEDEARKRD